MLAGGWRTAASWFRCAGVRDDWDRFYDLLQAIGKNAASLMLPILMFILKKFDPGEKGYWTLTIDDSPTKRFGPCVEAANIHHNPTPGPGGRGRPRKYGKNRISLKSRAANQRGWDTICYCCRGAMVERRYKTFLATSHVVGGCMRVVLFEYSRGNWAAYLSTDTEMSVELILKTAADRWAIEAHFHEVKEI